MNDSMTRYKFARHPRILRHNSGQNKKAKPFWKIPVIHPNAFTILSSKDSIISSAFFLAIFPVWGSLDLAKCFELSQRKC